MPAPAALLPPAKLCCFETGPGTKCNSPKVYSRGYCERHYSAMRRAGAFKQPLVKQTPVKELALANLVSVRRARRKLLKAAPDIVDAFVLGMKNQAQQGKTDAAQWAILHTHTLAPIATSGDKSGPNGVVVNIGVKVSGTATE